MKSLISSLSVIYVILQLGFQTFFGWFWEWEYEVVEAWAITFFVIGIVIMILRHKRVI